MRSRLKLGLAALLLAPWTTYAINSLLYPGKVGYVLDKDPDYKERFAAAAKTIPLRRLGTAEDVAEACLYLASENSYVTGQVIHLSGGEAMY